jgi:hypothetical protein
VGVVVLGGCFVVLALNRESDASSEAPNRATRSDDDGPTPRDCDVMHRWRRVLVLPILVR